MHFLASTSPNFDEYFVTEGTWAVSGVEEISTDKNPYYIRRYGDAYNCLMVDGKPIMEKRSCFSLYRLKPGETYGELVWSNEEKLRGFIVSPKLIKIGPVSYFVPSSQDSACPGHIKE